MSYHADRKRKSQEKEAAEIAAKTAAAEEEEALIAVVEMPQDLAEGEQAQDSASA